MKRYITYQKLLIVPLLLLFYPILAQIKIWPDLSSSANPIISGTATANSLISVFADGLDIGTTQANSLGNWSFLTANKLEEGAHTFSYAINSVLSTQTVNIKINPGTLRPPTIDSSISDYVTGRAEPFSTIYIFINGKLIGKTKTDDLGKWTYYSSIALTPATYLVSVIEKQQTGFKHQSDNTFMHLNLKPEKNLNFYNRSALSDAIIKKYGNINKLQSANADIVLIEQSITLLASATCLAGTCGTPGKDGANNNISGVINTYYPGQGTANASDTFISLGAAATGSSTTTIAPGDLLLVIQMQDATINFTDTAAYGSGNIANDGTGYTSLGNSGLYEFVVATNSVSLAGGIVTLACPLINSYVTAAPTAGTGQKSYQVVRFPQYTTGTLTGTLTALSWNGSAGGIVGFDATGNINFNGQTISANGAGFRGGGSVISGSATTSVSDYVLLSTNGAPCGTTAPCAAMKGEGIAGTPKATYDPLTNTIINTGIEGYPGGSVARGAPANAGGGGNRFNAGGAGGANGGAGGIGGNTLELFGTFPYGGRPGTAFPATISQITFGGGGGSGQADTAPLGSGNTGGGIVIVRANSITGAGNITANGNNGLSVPQPSSVDEGAGGGGAGGTIITLTKTGTLSGLNISSTGGSGGSTENFPGFRHGPGGGAGGGVIFLSSPANSTNVSGGAAGAVPVNYGATAGAAGIVNTAVSFTASPGAVPGAACIPVANPDSASTVQNIPVIVDVLANDTDPNNLPLSVISAGPPLHGVVVINIDNTVTYTPALNYTGPDSFPYTIQNIASATASSTVTITVIPEPPVITSPITGTITNNNTPAVAGTSNANNIINIFANAVLVGTTTADGIGNWLLPATIVLADGTYSLTATQTDSFSNTSAPSNPVVITIDTTAPLPPVITSPPTGIITNDNTPTLTGTAEANTIGIYQNGLPAGGTITDAFGNWTFTPSVPIPDGTYTFRATATDAAGNTSAPSNPVVITIDTTAPLPPVITSPSTGTITSDNTPTLTGTAEANTIVGIYRNGSPVGGTIADAFGNWTFTPIAPIPDGTYNFRATSTDNAGNTSAPSNLVVITIDTVPPSAPIITNPINGQAFNTSTPPVSGTDEPNTTITIFANGSPVGKTITSAFGNWLLPATLPLNNGASTLVAFATDAAGNTSPQSNSVSIIIDVSAPLPPTAVLFPDLSNSLTPIITGTAEPGSTITVYANNIIIGTTKADSSGNWIFEPVIDLPPGTYNLFFTATDATGNTSNPSIPITIVIDPNAPNPPTVTQTPKPVSVITGTAKPGSQIFIFINGISIGTTVANDSGQWSFSVPRNLPRGIYTITIIAAQPDNIKRQSVNTINDLTPIPLPVKLVSLTSRAIRNKYCGV